MLPVVWLDSAADDLKIIIEFIAERNPVAAAKLASQLIDDADRLSFMPSIYRHGRVAGTHELVSHPNYIIVFRTTLAAVEILAVLHSRQQYP
jgi:toxin ParE1/3/4